MIRLLCFSVLSFFAVGCEILVPEPEYPVSDSRTSAVLVVIEDSYIGRNLGADSDLRMMTEILSTVTDDIVVLKNGYATRRNVKSALKRACSNELAIVFFTCHGGREPETGRGRITEKDGYDEFIYLADTTIDDNELYDVFNTSTNRVFTIFNCCNSGTMFATMPNAQRLRAGFVRLGPSGCSGGQRLNLLSWSACGDGESAVSSVSGGEFVKSIYRTFKAVDGNLTYGEFWSIVRNSSVLRRYQRPEMNCIGDYRDFEDVKVFR